MPPALRDGRGDVRHPLIADPDIHDRGGELAKRDIDGCLRVADRQLRSTGQTVGKCVDGLVELRIVDGVINEAYSRRFFGIYPVAREEEFLGSGKSDKLWPDERSAVTGDLSDAHVRVGNEG